MAHRSQCSSAGDNPLDPNYLPPHYREEYRLAIDALVEEDLDGYYQFLQKADVVDFLSSPEIQYIQESHQVPQQSNNPEYSQETGGDGSSDTYWPIHSDLDAPGLDLGWPQLHHFIGPTEVTTLVNPPEPEMPSIKDQARRLIKTAQQVIAIAMDMFTDVDIFHDVLTAAMRNVAVYILLDENNAHHFVNMVSNCRVNLQSIQFLRVRTVSGITYHCRSGKSFKGQMMDRFLLTDCRAVLSGNYSFMWSFEKLHRCMAHLFLGQLVSTFDEEFRILFAQSQPLLVEDMLAPVEDFSLLQKRQYLSERTSLYREPRKFLSLDTAHPEEWPRHSYDERLDMDWRMMPLKRKETLHGPADMYSRFPSQQSRIDPSFDQGPSRMPLMENPYFKRHSYAEGIHGRHSYPFLPQQGMPEPENQGRQFHRWQQPYPVPGKEADNSSYDKFWNKDYLLADQYSEPGLPPEIEPPDNFDPVVNYLSSTGNVDFDQSSDKVLPAADLPFSSSFPRRLSLGQPYACETSPTPSNPTDQKQFFLEPNTDRKDPMVKRGLRDWRISSYLSTYENKEDEGLPLAPPNMPDPFEEPSNVIQQTTTVTPGIDLVVPKIPNVREFKVPAIPRASQMPSYIKITPREQPKNLPDEPTVHQASVTAETKTTPATSESSTTTEGEKTEEAEQKEPKPSVFQREDSFRRKYNAGLQRSSRLRSSLIFGSLEQQNTAQDTKTIPGQQDEESEKNESERTKPPFLSQGLGQRRSMAREPFEWSRYIKSATFDNSTTDPSKPDDGNSKAEDKCPSKDENSKNLSGKCEVQEILKPPNVEQRNSSPSVPQSKPSEVELTKAVQPMKPPKSLLTTPMFVDMNDADMRLMFFKELAAKRKAAMAAQAEKSKEKAQMKTPTEKKCTTIKKEEPGPQQTVESMGDTTTSEGLSEKNSIAEEAEKTSSTEACKSVSLSLEASDETVSQDGQVENDPNTNQSCEEAKTRFATDSEMIKLKNDQPAANLPVSAESETPQSESQEQPKLSRPAVEDRSPSHPPTTENATHENAPLAQGTDEDENPLIDSTSNESSLLVPRSEEVPPSAASDSNTPNPESMNLVTSIFYPPPSSEQHPESEFSSSRQSVKSASSNESSLLVPSSEEVPPSAASDSNTQSPESMNLVTSSSYPPPSYEQHPESEFSTSNQSIKSASSNESTLLVPSSEDVPPSEFAASDSNTQSPESVNLVTSSSCPPPSSEQHPESEFNTSNQSIESASSHLIVPDLGSQISPKPSPSCSVPIPSKAETVSSEVILEDSSSTLTSTILSTNEQETVSPSAQSVQETLEKPTAPVSQTESECTQPHSDSVSQSMSSETLSAVGPAHEESDISQDTCDAVSEPITSSLRSTAKTDSEESSAHSEQYVPGSENSSVPQASGEESEALGSSETVKADSTPPNPIHQSPESCLPDVADLESKPRSDQNEVIPTSSAADHPSETSVGETNSLVHPDSTTHPSQSETITSLQESPRQETAPSELQLTGPVTPSSVEIESCSPLAESVGSVLSHEAKQTLSALHTHPNTDSLPEQVTTDSNKTPVLQSTETCSPTEPTSKVPREPESVTSESQPSEPAVPAENGNMNRQNEVSQEAEMPDTEKKTDDTEAMDKVNKTTFKESPCSEKTNDQVRQNNCPEQPEISSDEVIPTTPQTKQPKSSQSRYHSSTANVLSSSNLRDDTKLLLEQISANSQSRNDAAKESPVTDDEKEGEADKNAKREKERGMRYLSRGQAKSNQEREMLLERIQSMRKERKVYSRFEMAP